jgi:hypothetical protein
MRTPTIPESIRLFRTSSYTNIYELCPAETRLYGTESLFGDWDGELLLLAKDFAPEKLVRERLERKESRPYRHTDWVREPRVVGAMTNRNLHALAGRVNCRKLYGSLLAGLLRKDGKTSGALPDERAIHAYVRDVLKFVIDHMPNLRAIACLGVDAWRYAADLLGYTGAEWHEYREKRISLKAKRVRLFALAHPSRYCGGKAKVEEDWQVMSRLFLTDA